MAFAAKARLRTMNTTPQLSVPQRLLVAVLSQMSKGPMTPEEMLRKVALENMRLEDNRRAFAMLVPCPVCLAHKTQACHDESITVLTHLERVRSAERHLLGYVRTQSIEPFVETRPVALPARLFGLITGGKRLRSVSLVTGKLGQERTV